MSPRSVTAWKRISAAALIVAALSMMVTAFLFARSEDDRDTIRDNVTAIERATDRIEATAARARAAERARMADQVERLDQTCTLFETDYLEDVRQLKATYKYLLDLPESEWRLTINQTVVRGLPRLEGEARTDSAPDFCDEPGRGLKEPGPVVPKKRDFSYILKAAS